MVSGLTLLQLKLQLRNRQALFWNFVFPILLMAILGWVFGDPSKPLAVGVVDGDQSRLSAQVIASLKGTPAYKVSEGFEQAELAALKKGDRLMVFIMEPGFAAGATSQSVALNHLRIVYDGGDPARASLAENTARGFTMQLVQALSGRQTGLGEPVLESTAANRVTYIDYLVPGIVALMILTANLMGMAVSVVSWRQMGVLRHMGTTPLPRWVVIVSRMIAGTITNLVQVAVAILIGAYVFKANILHHLGLTVMYTLVGCWVFMALAFGLASLVKTVEAAQPLSNLAVNVMMLLGGLVFRVDQAPAWIHPFIRALPITGIAEGLRSTMTTPGRVEVHASTLIGPGVWFVFAVALATRRFRWE